MLETQQTQLVVESTLPHLEDRKEKKEGEEVSVRKQKKKFVFSFEDIRYKDILQNITETMHSGKMTAILGPSGAGKTTLLKIIGGRKQKTGGRILLNGKELTSRKVRKHIAYVHQENHLFPQLTVKEMMMYTIRLKAPKEKEPEKLAHRLLEALGLKHIMNSYIGDPLQDKGSISGGEMKRLSVALELISTPGILFLDEPTSGLDSHMSESLVQYMKKLTASGLLVGMTIHQPSSDVFNMFDNVIVMRKGGIVYSGSIPGCIEYLERLGHPCPQYTNIADHIFRVMEQLPLLGQREKYRGEEERKEDGQVHSRKATFGGILQETKILISRNFLSGVRNKRYILAKWMQALIIGSVTGSLMYNIPGKEAHQRETNVHGCYWAISLGIFGAFAYGAVSILFVDRKILIKEYGSNYYNFISYFIAKVLVDYAMTCVYPIVSVPLIFLLTGIGSATDILACFLVGAVGHALGIFVSSAVDASEVALAILPGIVYPINMLTGSAVDTQSISSWLQFSQYLSPTRHSFNIMVKTHYQNHPKDLLESGGRTRSAMEGFLTVGGSFMFLIVYYLLLIVGAGVILKRKISMQSKGE
ncbi:ATP-binding cassette, subfamily G (WHITE), member 4 [Nematocida sp. AWRm77]|nr:ATP-binding cassette, subfamily G (WHITE), member 4 [Nematocida sp. AWRm77]